MSKSAGVGSDELVSSTLRHPADDQRNRKPDQADVDGDGQVSRGDYITMESYPVLTHGYPHVVIVRLRKVK